MINISKKFHPTENDLNSINDWLVKKLKTLPEEQRGRAHMAGIELLENAVKYHLNQGISIPINFEITIDETIDIKITNHLKTRDDAKDLILHIDKINSGIDPKIQYMHRLKEIMEHRVPNESRLGLLRIAGEGNFSIQYELSGNCITVSAKKYFYQKRNIMMDSLIRKDFSISVKEGDPWEIVWTGKSRELNPSLFIDEYLDELLSHLLDKEVMVDFSTMEAMNSSTIPPILNFLTSLENKRVRTVVKYSKDIYWQRASFKPLAILTRDFTFVKISAI